MSWSYFKLITRDERESNGEIQRSVQNGISIEIPPLARTTRSFNNFAEKTPRPSKVFKLRMDQTGPSSDIL